MVVAVEAYAFPEFIRRRRHGRAGQHVAVSVEIFGGGVHHDIGAKGERLRQERRRHRVVDHQPRAGGMGNIGKGGEIVEIPVRVGRRLGPDDGRDPRNDRGTHGLQVRHVDMLDPHAPMGGVAFQPGPHAVIHVDREDAVRAGLQRQHHGGHGRHAGTEQPAVRSPFQRLQSGLRLLQPRIAITAVAPTGRGIAVRRAQESGREMDRRDHGACRIRILAGALGEDRVGDILTHAKPLPSLKKPDRPTGNPYFQGEYGTLAGDGFLVLKALDEKFITAPWLLCIKLSPVQNGRSQERVSFSGHRKPDRGYLPLAAFGRRQVISLGGKML